MEESFQVINQILSDKFGILFLDTYDDYDISDYITDSISFIQFIVEIEERIGMRLTDDFLNYGILASARGFATKMDYYVEQEKKHL